MRAFGGTNSPTISASLCQTTMLCHSVRSWNFAALVLESFVGSQAESSNQTTTCGVFDFRVISRQTDENDFVCAFHNLTP